MILADAWEDNGSLYFEVRVTPETYVTVKKPEPAEDFLYVLENPDGTYIYDHMGNTYESEYPFEAIRFISRMEDENLITCRTA